MSCIEKSWRTRGLIAVLLLPVSWLYGILLSLRRLAYARGWKAPSAVPLPVVVIGNLSVGGTGKTPLCGYLVERFAKNGWRPAIVSRGYGGRRWEVPRLVNKTDTAAQVGDEPVLLFHQTGVPVCVCVHRAMAVQKIAQTTNANIVFSDDGLQHLAMPRVAQVLVVDGQRGFGNSWVLPAGPLRDTFNSVRDIDLVAIQVPIESVRNAELNRGPGQLHHSLYTESLRQLYDGSRQLFALDASHAVQLTTGATVALSEFSNQRVHAVAGIGHPQRFFDSLAQLGMDVIKHAKADHAPYTLSDISFDDDLPVLVTVKDAVKVLNIEHLPNKVYQVNTQVTVSVALEEAIVKLEDKLSFVAVQ